MIEKEDKLTYNDIPKILFHQLKCSFNLFGGLIPPFPHYMNFLNLTNASTTKLSKSIQKLEKIFQCKPIAKINKAILELLISFDWRPQIIACVAIGKLERKQQKEFILPLWEKLEKEGSWIEPQILAILSWIDDNFIANHKKYLSYEDLNYEKFNKNDIEVFIHFLCNEENTKKYNCRIYIEWRERLKELFKH